MRSQSQISVESCTLHLLSWRPFHTISSNTLDSSLEPPHKPYGSHITPKRPCLTDRSTAFSIEALSRLSLADDDNRAKSSCKRRGFWPVERKRRRRGSEFQFAIGTDSSGELFCEANRFSDVSEATRNSRRDRDSNVGEKEGGGGGFGLGIGIGVVEPVGCEPGYRGDAEIGYGDEFDEEERRFQALVLGSYQI